jgi:hypothetical protein
MDEYQPSEAEREKAAANQAAVRPHSDVQAAQTGIAKNLSLLTEVLDQLKKQLGPVMRPHDKEDSKGDGQAKAFEPSSAVVHEMRDHAARIQNAVNRVNTLRSRLTC